MLLKPLCRVRLKGPAEVGTAAKLTFLYRGRLAVLQGEPLRLPETDLGVMWPIDLEKLDITLTSAMIDPTPGEVPVQVSAVVFSGTSACEVLDEDGAPLAANPVDAVGGGT